VYVEDRRFNLTIVLFALSINMLGHVSLKSGPGNEYGERWNSPRRSGKAFSFHQALFMVSPNIKSQSIPPFSFLSPVLHILQPFPSTNRTFTSPLFFCILRSQSTSLLLQHNTKFIAPTALACQSLPPSGGKKQHAYKELQVVVKFSIPRQERAFRLTAEAMRYERW